MFNLQRNGKDTRNLLERQCKFITSDQHPRQTRYMKFQRAASLSKRHVFYKTNNTQNPLSRQRQLTTALTSIRISENPTIKLPIIKERTKPQQRSRSIIKTQCSAVYPSNSENTMSSKEAALVAKLNANKGGCGYKEIIEVAHNVQELIRILKTRSEDIAAIKEIINFDDRTLKVTLIAAEDLITKVTSKENIRYNLEIHKLAEFEGVHVEDKEFKKVIYGKMKDVVKLFNDRYISEAHFNKSKRTSKTTQEHLKEIMDIPEETSSPESKKIKGKACNRTIAKVLDFALNEEKLDMKFIGNAIACFTRAILLGLLRLAVVIYNKNSARMLKKKRVWSRQVNLNVLLQYSCDQIQLFHEICRDKTLALLRQNNEDIEEEINEYKRDRKARIKSKLK